MDEMKLFELFRAKDIFPNKAKELTSTFSYVLKNKNIKLSDFSEWLDILEKSIPDDTRSKTGLLIYKLTENSFNIHFKKRNKSIENISFFENKKEYFKKRENLSEIIVNLILSNSDIQNAWHSFTNMSSATNVINMLFSFGIKYSIIFIDDIPQRDYLSLER